LRIDVSESINFGLTRWKLLGRKRTAFRGLNNEGITDLRAINSFFRQRVWVLLSLCIVTPLGFCLWGYDGPGKVWFNFYATGILYEIFWCLVLFFFWPKRENALKIAVFVFVMTCVLEVLQLWEPMFLEKIRSTFLGMALIGTSFVWRQFPHYVLGSLIGLVWLRKLGKKLDCDSYEYEKHANDNGGEGDF